MWDNWPNDIGLYDFLSDPYEIEISYSDWTNTLDDFDVELNLIDHENIDENPLFEIEDGLYNLSADSPCIDAGDPNSQPDPDGTIADMGANYYHQEYIIGDVNGDFIIDILDLVGIIDIILGEEPTTLQVITADLDNSGIINVLDVILLIQIILNGG